MNTLWSKRIVIIGAGNIGRILLERLTLAGMPVDRLLIYDREVSRAQQTSLDFGVHVCELDNEMLCSADIFLLAPPPKAIIETLATLAPYLHDGQLVVSFAAGVSLHRLEAIVPQGVSVVRVMPNAPSLVGQGMNPVAYGTTILPDAQIWLHCILRTLGQHVVVNDIQMNWCVGLTGAAMRSLLPALEGMTQAGVEAGFAEKEARHMATRVMLGTAAMLITRGLTFDEIKSLTPMETLDEAGLRNTFFEAARTAREKIDRLQEKLEQSEPV